MAPSACVIDRFSLYYRFHRCIYVYISLSPRANPASRYLCYTSVNSLPRSNISFPCSLPLSLVPLSLSLSRSTVTEASFSIRLLPVCFYLRRRSLFFQASFKDTCLLGYLWLLYFDHRDTVSRFDRLFVKEFSKGKLSSDVIGSLFILFFLNRVNQDGLFNSEIY